MSDTTVVHLLRHGEVDNPHGIIYGRLPGYHLSANGQAMAAAAADYFSERAVVALFSSPLERAQETARPVAERSLAPSLFVNLAMAALRKSKPRAVEERAAARLLEVRTGASGPSPAVSPTPFQPGPQPAPRVHRES